MYDILSAILYSDGIISQSKIIMLSKLIQTVLHFGYIHKFILSLLLVSFAAGGYIILWFNDNFVTEPRYPLYEEAAIIYRCANAGNALLKDNSEKERQRICACALQETMQKIDFLQYQEKPRLFNQYLGKGLLDCSKASIFG